jgi:hypothetical protein
MGLLAASDITRLNSMCPMGSKNSIGSRLTYLDTDGILKVPANGGIVYYVDTVLGSNSNDGLSWAGAFLTMTYANTLVADGDTILVRGNIAEASVTLAANRVTIRGVTPHYGSANASQGVTWLEAAKEQVQLVNVTGKGNRFENITFRGCRTDTTNTTYSLGRCVTLAAAHGTQFVNCRFQGRVGTMAAIYSAAATTDDVDIIGCEFVYWNTATYGTAILGIQAGGLAYSGWRIVGCTFNSNVQHIKLCMRGGLIQGCTFAEYGVTAAGAVDAVTTLGISLVSTSGVGGGANQVVGNYLDGAYTSTLYKVNADVSGSDNWCGNYCYEQATTAPYGLTQRNPA